VAFASPLKLPAAGARTFSLGQIVYEGSSSYYLSSTSIGSFARMLNSESGNSATGDIPKSSGGSVRCIKE